MSEKTDDGELDFEMVQSNTRKEDDVLLLGNQIKQQLDKSNEVPIRSLESFLQGVSVSFVDDFEYMMDNLCRLTTPSIDMAKSWRNSGKFSSVQLI